MVQLPQLVVASSLWLGLGWWASLPPTGLALPEVLFRCPPCTADRLASCHPAGFETTACPELVREPGCGCCPVCARFEGEPCGVYTPRCVSGFRCYPTPGSELPLQALVQGHGTCTRWSAGAEYDATTAEHTGAAIEEHPERTAVENIVDGASTAMNGRQMSEKEIAIIRDKTNEQQKLIGRHVYPPIRVPPLRTPCQQELDQVLERISTMRLPDERGPLEHLYSLNIPNCDKQGLYNLKQCKMSVNGQRGECWCVNPNTGKTILGSPTIRGDPECHLFYTDHEDRGTPAFQVQ
ncbi:insulin-like growth factor-binding protein 2 [Thamnophis elegans]|uniref:insulin-like growth factor-binding protein 2 n=1 Tax=Thamnophis elegans TaxID=35005 RepID=UPI0013777BEC|nr:insulin-like growth factor-binding protein 2 [Thamnophis elegans]